MPNKDELFVNEDLTLTIPPWDAVETCGMRVGEDDLEIGCSPIFFRFAQSGTTDHIVSATDTLK